MLAKIDRPDSVIVKKADDRVAKYLLLAIGHNGHMSVVVIVTPIRVVCMNTLRASLAGANQIRIPHTKGAGDALKTVQETILRVDAQFEKAAEIFRKLASIKIKSDKQLRAYVDAVFKVVKKDEQTDDSFAGLLAKAPHAPREREPGDFITQETKSRVYDEVQQLLTGGKGNDLPGVKGTAWAAYNAVTEYNTWKRGRTMDARLDQLWLKNSGPVERALPAAVDVFVNDNFAAA